MNHYCTTFQSAIPESLCVKRIDSKEYPLCLSCAEGLVISAGFDRSADLLAAELRQLTMIKARLDLLIDFDGGAE